MSGANMAALRQDAYSLLERMPDEKLMIVIQFMRSINEPAPRKKRGENSEAFKRLEQLCRPIPGLDEEKELAEWREEKFGYAGAD